MIAFGSFTSAVIDQICYDKKEFDRLMVAKRGTMNVDFIEGYATLVHIHQRTPVIPYDGDLVHIFINIYADGDRYIGRAEFDSTLTFDALVTYIYAAIEKAQPREC